MSALQLGTVGFRLGIATEWDIPVGAILTLRVRRPDLEHFEIPVTRADTRLARLVTDATLYEPDRISLVGTYRLQLRVTHENDELLSRVGTLKVEAL